MHIFTANNAGRHLIQPGKARLLLINFSLGRKRHSIKYRSLVREPGSRTAALPSCQSCPPGAGRAPRPGIPGRVTPRGRACPAAGPWHQPWPHGAAVLAREQPGRTCRALRAPQRPARRRGSAAPLASASPAEPRGSPVRAAVPAASRAGRGRTAPRSRSRPPLPAVPVTLLSPAGTPTCPRCRGGTRSARPRQCLRQGRQGWASAAGAPRQQPPPPRPPHAHGSSSRACRTFSGTLWRGDPRPPPAPPPRAALTSRRPPPLAPAPRRPPPERLASSPCLSPAAARPALKLCLPPTHPQPLLLLLPPPCPPRWLPPVCSESGSGGRAGAGAAGGGAGGAGEGRRRCRPAPQPTLTPAGWMCAAPAPRDRPPTAPQDSPSRRET